MGELTTTTGNNRRRQEKDGGRSQNKSSARGSEWDGLSGFMSWVPLALVILSLAGIAFAPLVVRERTKRMRSDMRNASEPTRLLLGDLRAGLAREQTLAQRFTVDHAPAYWTSYARTVARDDSVLNRIGVAMKVLGPDAQNAFDTLYTRINRWREIAAIDGHRSGTLFLEQLVQRGVTYEDLLYPTLRVDSAVATAMQIRRANVDSLNSLALGLTIFFVAVGCVASAAVLVLTLRGRQLRMVLQRRAEEETALRTLARALSGAVTVPDVAGLTVSAAIQLSRVGGAYLAVTRGKELEVLAARGSSVSKEGKSFPLPLWITNRRRDDEPRVLTCERRPRGEDHRGGVEITSQLVVPMHYDGKVIGLLALRSAGGRRAFGPSTARYGRALGDLAAVAMRRAEALQHERDARVQAEDAVHTRDRVVSIVSHDLRNPLTVILGGADLLLDVIPNDPQRDSERDQLERMRHAATTMNRLIADLLDITRLESGPLPIHFVELNITDVIDDAMNLFQAAGQQRKIMLERPASGGLPTVWGDPDRLVQMLSNLLANALKFTPQGGSIGVQAVLNKEGNVELSVHDTGSGIPAERLKHLFDRFWHVTHDHRGGLGLGLSIVRAITDAHGAQLNVESAPDHGTTFKVALKTAAGRPDTTPRARERVTRVDAAAKRLPPTNGGEGFLEAAD